MVKPTGHAMCVEPHEGGHRGTCACGWRGPTMRSMSSAQLSVNRHQDAVVAAKKAAGA